MLHMFVTLLRSLRMSQDQKQLNDKRSQHIVHNWNQNNLSDFCVSVHLTAYPESYNRISFSLKIMRTKERAIESLLTNCTITVIEIVVIQLSLFWIIRANFVLCFYFVPSIIERRTDKSFLVSLCVSFTTSFRLQSFVLISTLVYTVKVFQKHYPVKSSSLTVLLIVIITVMFFYTFK